MRRSALLRFRVRTVCGVGARADVLCELLAEWPAWTTAAELAQEGYSKRNVARILRDLEAAGLVRARPLGNRLAHRLHGVDHLSWLVGREPPRIPRWRTLFRILSLLIDLAAGLEGLGAASRRVAAHETRERLLPLCAELQLADPPVTVGDATAYERLLAWGANLAAGLAAGSSPALMRGDAGAAGRGERTRAVL